MQLTIKTIQQKSFTVEAEGSHTIAQVKQAIEASQGFPVAHQKLIYSGKILSDDATVEASKITETQFLVVMVTKPKAAPAPVPAVPAVPATPTAPAVPALAPVPAPAAPDLAVTSPTPLGPNPPAAVLANFDASTLATGTAYQAAVQNLIEMGFPAEQVSRAMKAAYNNPDRAAEYLMTGIPENIEALQGPPAGAAAGAAAARPATAAAPAAPSAATPNEAGYVNLFEAGAAAASRPATAAAGAAGAGAVGAADMERMNALRNSPEFAQFRQLIQAQPQLLQPMLQQLGQSQPELLRTIQQNPDAFLQLLGEGGEGMDFGDDDDAEGGAGGAQTIQITPEENAAIERLTALGFDRNLAAQAYFACDKNEELAANYLFENGGDW
ncbi:hypothetical protein BDR26DRAFT_920988 [Obelidium mucronatum]|nr:hypothetical protein BDR26DRAFT_920988 [Obelidium mucronatum]